MLGLRYHVENLVVCPKGHTTSPAATRTPRTEKRPIIVTRVCVSFIWWRAPRSEWFDPCKMGDGASTVGYDGLRMRENKKSGGEGGIRTHGTVSRTLAFEASTFNRSVTSPQSWQFHRSKGSGFWQSTVA